MSMPLVIIMDSQADQSGVVRNKAGGWTGRGQSLHNTEYRIVIEDSLRTDLSSP